MPTPTKTLFVSLAAATAVVVAVFVDAGPPPVEPEPPPLTASPGAEARAATARALAPIHEELGRAALGVATAALRAAASADPDDRAPVLPVSLDAWPVALADDRLDAVAARGAALHVATQVIPDRPLLDPAVVRIRTLDADGDEAEPAWEARILGPSALALASSGGRVAAAWSQRAHPGRDLVVMELPERVADARHVVLRPDDGGAFEPAGRPLLAPIAADAEAARPAGWLVCSSATLGPPRCARVGPRRDGDAADGTTWQALPGLKSHPNLWGLVPVGAGFFLFATDCAPESCRVFRVVLQELDAHGAPRGRLRVISRLLASRRAGVLAAGDGAVLFGRRANAKASMAMHITRRRATDLDGRWDRTVGGVTRPGGALLLEQGRLHMVDGLPVTGHRPRRFTVREQRADPERWPEAVAELLPVALEQTLLVERDVVAFVAAPPEGGRGLRGVAVRPGRAEADAAVADAPRP